MNVRAVFALRRIFAVLLLAAGLGGCAVYGLPYAYGPGYSGYGYPVYAGSPVTLDLGFGYYSGRPHHHHRGYHHGWRSHGGHKHGWSHHHGGWKHGRGRH